MEEGQGEYMRDPEDTSGRLMKRAGKGKGNYMVYSEGVDNDNDGKYNEDELWCGGKVIDYNKDGKISELEILRWNDEAL